MRLKTIDDLTKLDRMEVEAFVRSISPVNELMAWLPTLNDDKVNLAHQQTQINRGARAAEATPKLRSTYRIEPSSIHNCTRMLWYQLQGAEKRGSINARLRCIFDTGTAIHEQLQAYFETMWGSRFQDEVGVRIEDLFMAGHTDGLYTCDDYRFLLEIKSIGHKGFVDLGGSPKKEHPQQFHCYMRANDVPFGFLIYYDKDKNVLDEYPVVFNPALWGSIETKCGVVIDADDDGPVRDKHITKWVCKDCNYKHLCTWSLA